MINKFIPPLAAGSPRLTRKTHTFIATLGVALGTLLSPALNAWAQQPFPFAGVWVVKMPGSPLLETFSISASDSTGTNGLMSVNSVIVDPTFGGAFTNAQSLTPGVGQVILTGTTNALFHELRYGMGTGPAGPQIEYFALFNGTFTLLSPDQASVLLSLSLYLPSQDTHGAGVPDPDQPPVNCAAFPLTMTRMPLLSPCTPKPLLAPALSISHQADDSVAIGWSAQAAGFALKSTMSLLNTNWAEVPGVQSNRVVIQPSGPKQFYRLEKQ